MNATAAKPAHYTPEGNLRTLAALALQVVVMDDPDRSPLPAALAAARRGLGTFRYGLVQPHEYVVEVRGIPAWADVRAAAAELAALVSAECPGHDRLPLLRALAAT